ncbi:aldo/keto reductase [Sphaerisporangium sp. NPDC049002]|uniref:aldo/keto reductase n=1 Tax=unclassified Sphaerisporangium TaxID=2630420 RepID=UPI0033D9D5BD
MQVPRPRLGRARCRARRESEAVSPYPRNDPQEALPHEAQAADIDLTGSGRAAVERNKFDTSLPENALKLQAVGELTKLAAEAGLSLPHLAIGFVTAHPAVTSVIIGPRTMEQLDDLLTGADTVLSEDVLDRIDEIVPPGTDLNRADSYYVPPALADKALRRRAAAESAGR